MEEWRAVIGFEDSYEVSSLGKVRSKTRVDHAGRMQYGRLLAPQIGKRGKYLVINLRRDGKTHSKKVHHLVALAFLGEPPGPLCIGPGCYEVNHIDGVKTNAKPENLEYITRKGNIEHAVATGLLEGTHVGERNGRAKLSAESVRTIRALYAAGGTSIPKLAREFGVGKSTIGYIVQGATWGHLEEPPSQQT